MLLFSHPNCTFLTNQYFRLHTDVSSQGFSSELDMSFLSLPRPYFALEASCSQLARSKFQVFQCS